MILDAFYTYFRRVLAMLCDLPHYIQQQILSYLETNNFIAAKKLKDQYVAALHLKSGFSIRNLELF